MDTLDLLNLSRFCSGMATGLSEAIDGLPLDLEDKENDMYALALNDYFSQLVEMASYLRECAIKRQPLDFSHHSHIDQLTGTDFIDTRDI